MTGPRPLAPRLWRGYDVDAADYDWADAPAAPPAKKCECGLGPDGGVHSDWCPLAGQASPGRHG